MSATYIAVTLVAFILVFAIIGSFFSRKSRKRIEDPRANMQPNDTNYNIDMVDEQVIKNATPEEAMTIINNFQKGKLPSLSEKDFYELVKKVENS